jgi:hypothetical protein
MIESDPTCRFASGQVPIQQWCVFTSNSDRSGTVPTHTRYDIAAKAGIQFRFTIEKRLRDRRREAVLNLS